MDKDEFNKFLRTELAKEQTNDKQLLLEVMDEDLYIKQQSLRTREIQTPSISGSSSQYTVPSGKEVYPEIRLCTIRVIFYF